MQASGTPRGHKARECDHMRPVVLVDGVWRHVQDGEALSICGTAGIYEVEATYEGVHYLTHLDQRGRGDGPDESR